LSVRSLAAVVAVCALLSTLPARAKDVVQAVYMGPLFASPGDVDLRLALFAHEKSDPIQGFFISLDMEPQRVAWKGPDLNPGQIDRNFAVRAGWLPSIGPFGIGPGVIIDVLTMGLPKEWNVAGYSNHDTIGGAGLDIAACFGIENFGVTGDFMYELMTGDQHRTGVERNAYASPFRHVGFAAGITVFKSTWAPQTAVPGGAANFSGAQFVLGLTYMP
jgi:hypothetical protein